MDKQHTTMFFAVLKSAKGECYRQEIFEGRKSLRDFLNWCNEQVEDKLKYHNEYCIITNCKIFRDEN